MKRISLKTIFSIKMKICIFLFVVLVVLMPPWALQADLLDTPVKIQIYNTEKAFNIIVVQKTNQQLTLYSVSNKNLKVIRQFACSTGKKRGNKKKEGDAKTPSGVYFVTGEFRDKDLAEIYGTRAFPLDYPNALDRENDRNGSAIWLHGTDKKLKPYQTNGCVALNNQDIDTLKSYISFNRTPVFIVGALDSIIVSKDTPWQIFLDKALQIQSS